MPHFRQTFSGKSDMSGSEECKMPVHGTCTEKGYTVENTPQASLEEKCLETSKPVTIFLHQEDHIKELFKGLKIADCSRFSVPADEDTASTSGVVRDHLAVSDSMTCSHCRVTFADRPQQVDHYKSDFHKYNVKRRSCGQAVFTEQDFAKLSMDDDVLSISGSESEDDGDSETPTDRDEDSTSASESVPVRPKRRGMRDEKQLRQNQLKRHTKLFLVNANRQMFCLYKCLIMSKWAPAGDSQVELAVKQLPRSPRIAVLLLAGGHFAAAVFIGGKAVLHKTFHSYTVRAKQGGSQSARDGRSAGGHCRSAGASLRRYNEASLVQHIQELLVSWEQELARCSLLFVRALGSGAAALYGGRAPPLNKRDPRIRGVPFPTRRPTFAELERVYTALTAVHVYGTDVDVDPSEVPLSPPRPEAPARAPRRSPRADPASPASPGAGEAGEAARPAGRSPRMTARDRRNGERLLQLEEALAEHSDASDASDGSDGEYEVRQMRDLADLSSFAPEEGFDSARPLDDPVVTATEAQRRRRELRRRLRQAERQAAAGALPPPPPQADPASRPAATSEASPEQPEPDGAEEYRVQCYTLCKTGDSAALEALLDQERAPMPTAGLLVRKFGQARQTLLHAAARAGHAYVVRRLLERGGDPTVRDAAGQAPYDVAPSKEVRNEFRRYRAAYPDRHNYAKAHIPGPLTEEMEEERKQREAEKKRIQNQKRKEKMKEKKAQKKMEDEARKEAEKEEEERQRFLKLSDREKRALAAERRISQQAALRSGAAPVLVRCHQCGADITGRVPFEYASCVFCTTDCVKRHRAAAAAAAAGRA